MSFLIIQKYRLMYPAHERILSTLILCLISVYASVNLDGKYASALVNKEKEVK